MLFEDVREFNKAIGTVAPDEPTLPDADAWKLGMSLINEEFRELIIAWRQKDLPEFADAIGDLLYVVARMYYVAGIDGRPVDAAIHQANMAKVGGPVREDGKLLKPEGWQPPDIQMALAVGDFWDKAFNDAAAAGAGDGQSDS